MREFTVGIDAAIVIFDPLDTPTCPTCGLVLTSVLDTCNSCWGEATKLRRGEG